ncbi:MAG: radical SAM protein [Pseudomonadota bacterium]
MNLASFAAPFISYHLGGGVTPVLAGYKITHRCNLKCSHCPYWSRKGPESDFSDVTAALKCLKKMGARILIIEGGEPLLWKDGRKTIRDVVGTARDLFGCVCMTTNGTIPWGELPLDRVWVSLDGTEAVHDSIRGAGVFRKVLGNLEREGRGEALISLTISKANAGVVADLIKLLKERVAGVTLQFYYPYGGLPDPLFISPAERGPILDELMTLKSMGYPVANSYISLTDLKRPVWSCEDRLLANAEPDGSVRHGCYLKNRGPSVCAQCGFSAHNEMTLAFKGRPESILTGMRIFFPFFGLARRTTSL